VKAPKVLEHIKPAHIACTSEEIAPIVVMPGDPLRAKYIAENFLSEAKLVSDTRNMFAYVPQGKFILSGTIRENITFVNPNISDMEWECQV